MANEEQLAIDPSVPLSAGHLRVRRKAAVPEGCPVGSLGGCNDLTAIFGSVILISNIVKIGLRALRTFCTAF